MVKKIKIRSVSGFKIDSMKWGSRRQSWMARAEKVDGFVLEKVELSHRGTDRITSQKIPAKKWGDTEIAERGRSVLVMRARYRSAGLTLHQRGWTDAG